MNQKFLEQMDAYAAELEAFVEYHGLPEQWFVRPDHVAVKCADRMDYEDTMLEFKPDAEQRSQIKMDGRYLGTVKLLSSIAVGNFGEVAWIEVMEPRPEKVGKDIMGFEHMEFLYPDFASIRTKLDDKNIPYEMQQNSGHRWVNIVINDMGQELKLNDRTLGAIVVDELEQGKSKLL
jgi:predicted metalloenzyme YecM